MFLASYIVINLILICSIFEAKSTQMVNVMLSQIDEAFMRLDMKIVENFGKKFNFQIEYITSNESLNEMFSSEDRIRNFFELTQNSLVIFIF